MLYCVGVAHGMLHRFCRNMPENAAPQHNASGMNEPKELFCIGQQFLAIVALLLSTINVIFYIETRYMFIKVGHYDCTFLKPVYILDF